MKFRQVDCESGGTFSESYEYEAEYIGYGGGFLAKKATKSAVVNKVIKEMAHA